MANASQFGEGVEGWCTVTAPGTEECFQTPLEACQRQWDYYVYNKSTNPFKGYQATEHAYMKGCDWVTWLEGGNVDVLPATVDFHCAQDYQYSPPDRCVKKLTEERCPNDLSEGASPIPTGGTNPIFLTTGHLARLIDLRLQQAEPILSS
jgi:hypothetical protein